jgi:F5/8 type C domain/Secretion system C-terminal sorting domain/Fibronectin type III domain
MKIFTLAFLCILLSKAGITQNVWTQHNDQGRTGWYPYETTLNIGNVNKNTFGFYFNHTTDDKIVAQPLVVLNVNIPNKGFKNIVFAATLNNTIYAYDADVNAEPYWQQNYTNKVAVSPGPDCTNCRPARASDIHPSLCGGSYGDFSGNMGIIGTPVIDTASGTMFFVTKIVNLNDGIFDNHSYVNNIKDEYNYTTTCFHQYLHAIDITTGIERANSPVEISAMSTGTGDGQTSPGKITFNPRTQFNRAGLVLSRGVVYIAFGAHCDNNPSHGWIIGYSASSMTPLYSFDPTPNDGRGGTWMSGTAPAVDENGNLYFTTGNSLNENRTSSNYNTYNALPSDPANRGEGVIKLAPDLTLSSYFTPFNYIALNDADKDFGTQVMLLPNTNLAMTGCKDDTLYVMDKTNLGGFDLHKNAVKQTVAVQSGATMHSTFAYFGGPTPYAYQFSENSSLKSYKVSASGLGTITTNGTIVGPSGGTGGFLSVSSNGSDPSTGILWAYQPINGCNANNNNCHGILHAVNAGDITNELWNSDMTTVDQVTIFNKFSCPTIALGKVYIAANLNQLCVYGLKTNTSCVTNVAKGETAVALTTASGFPASNVTDGSFSTSWRANTPGHDVDSIYIDLGSSYDICRIGITWEASRYGKDFDLKVSDDKINWTTVNSVRGNATTYSEFNGAVTGRYVNMVGITRGTGNGYGIFEFQVFGNPASACRAPSGLTASSITPTSEHISWDAISGAGQYLIHYRPNLSVSWISRTSNTNSIDLTALSCGSIYYYTVQANCGTSQSTISLGSFTPTGCVSNSCDIPPVRYYNVDLGDIGVAGSTCKNGNTYTISGSGTDIGGVSDQFQFAYTNNDNADYDVYGRIVQQDLVNVSNKMGIMVRDSLTNTSRFAFLGSVGNGYNMIFEYRDQASSPVTTINIPGHYSLPYWMKISKSGTQYKAYISADNIIWSQVSGLVELHFGNDPSNIPNYGMAITSENNVALSTGKIDNFTFVGSNPLPIQLLNFSAKTVNQDHVVVTWATSMEHLVDHFEIQRSVDNNTFRTIDKVTTTGESEIPRYYLIVDNNPAAGINYYRLKEVDRDAKFYFSPVASVQFDEPKGLEIFPNPAGDYTMISSQRDQILEVNVYDVAGKLLQNLPSVGGQLTVRLNTTELSTGVYIIWVKTTGAIYRQKLFKQ